MQREGSDSAILSWLLGLPGLGDVLNAVLQLRNVGGLTANGAEQTSPRRPWFLPRELEVCPTRVSAQSKVMTFGAGMLGCHTTCHFHEQSDLTLQLEPRVDLIPTREYSCSAPSGGREVAPMPMCG